MRSSLPLTLLLIVLGGCLPDDRMKIAYDDVPRARDDGWELSTPEAEGLDKDAMQAAYRDFFSEDQYPTAISLLVVRHGKIVSEGYCRDRADIDRLGAIQSATKSVTSLLTGMVIADGDLDGVDQPIAEVIGDKFPEGQADKRALTVEDLLTMRTGLAFPNGDYSIELLIDGKADSLAYILDKPLADPPGSEFDYIDASPHLLAGVLQRAIGTTLEDYARERLFGPLGIDDFLWERYRDGITYGAVGLYLTPRDLARIGLLVLRGGLWEGEQLVPAAWIEASSQPLVETTHTETLGYHYGYYWWVQPGNGAFSADGHGGQFVYVVPERDLLVVMTAEPHTKNGVAAIELDDFQPLIDQILDAVRD